MEHWTRDQTLRLISIFKRHPALYDKNYQYQGAVNQFEKDKIWQAIASEMKPFKHNTTMRDVKNKVRTLKHQLSRDIFSGTHIRKLWCFDDLKFLVKHLELEKLELLNKENKEDSINGFQDELAVALEGINELNQEEWQQNDTALLQGMNDFSTETAMEIESSEQSDSENQFVEISGSEEYPEMSIVSVEDKKEKSELWSKRQTLILIHYYKNCPALYNQRFKKTHKNYEQWQYLLNKMKKVKPNTNLEDIKEKVRTLCNQWNKANRYSNRRHKTKLWCYDQLNEVMQIKYKNKRIHAFNKIRVNAQENSMRSQGNGLEVEENSSEIPKINSQTQDNYFEIEENSSELQEDHSDDDILEIIDLGKAKWNMEQTSILIDLLEQCPSLYDPEHDDFSNHIKRKEYYEYLANEMNNFRPNTSATEVKTKIRVLFNQLSKERAAMYKAKSAGTEYKPKLWCFNKLKFLINKEMFPYALQTKMNNTTSANENNKLQTGDFEIDVLRKNIIESAPEELISATSNAAPIIRPQTSQGIQSYNLNCLSNTSQIIITPMSKALTPVQQNDNNLSFTITPSNVVYQLPNTSATLIPIKSPTPSMPQISAVHSQYATNTVTSKVCKINFTPKVIKENPKIYLGIEKKELIIIKVLANSCQLTQKQIFLILRKMRHHEPVEILADHFKMHPDEVVQTIIDYAPKMACMFRKCLKFASMRANPINSALKRIQIAVYKPSYLTDRPEEISRFSKKVELSYLVSCTQTGFVNFVSKGLEMPTKQNNNISELFKFINNANPKSVHIVGKRFGKINESYLAHRDVKVKTSPPSISCKMHLIRVFDEIKQFKILANCEVPLRYEFFSIVDDFFIIACGLYNCKLV